MILFSKQIHVKVVAGEAAAANNREKEFSQV
jgi:hypothetical protein